tara:strand:+ start:575 stop:1009 length:435 start_codon:yes stop_codon:yes gene_type:complete
MTNKAVEEIMGTYTPVEVKRIIHDHSNDAFVHHQDTQDIMKFYKEHNSDVHHWLLDDATTFEYYADIQQAYNKAQRGLEEEDRFVLQTYFIRDVIYLFIATVCYDLAQSHDLIHKTFKEVEDWQLSVDLEHRKKQLHVIDGGKR